jgi:hypothetical protein
MGMARVSGVSHSAPVSPMTAAPNMTSAARPKGRMRIRIAAITNASDHPASNRDSSFVAARLMA